jgi:hypothetical protein
MEPEAESEPVFEGLAPDDIEAVGVRDRDGESDAVELGDVDGVPVLDDVVLEVGVTLRDRVLVVLGVPELLGVNDALAPKDRVVVGVSESDELRDAEVEAVDDEVPDGVAVALLVGEFDAVLDAVGLAETVALGLTDGVPDLDGELLADAPRDSVIVGVLVCDDERLGVDDKLSLTDGVCDGVEAALEVPEPVPVDVGDGVALKLMDVEPEAESEPVFEELTPTDNEAVGV